MSLFGALSASLTSLTAQSAAVNSISNNIANLSTTGFKATSVSFATLVTGNVGGGVLQGFRNNIDSQGSIESTGNATDLAIQGSGFFVAQNISGEIVYTRAGSYRTDANGNLVNEAGYKLMGWPLDSEGRLPGVAGNTTHRTSNQDAGSLVPVSTASITGTASPTTAITAKINLKAEEEILEGAGDTTSFATTGYNNNIASDSVIAPSGAGMAIGETFTITAGGGGSVTYTYGGFAESNDITAGIGGATTANDTMSGFTDGDAFTITPSPASAFDPITFTFQTTPTSDSNEFSNLNELAQLINSKDGLTARVANNRLYVAPTTIGHTLDFTEVGAGTIVASLGISDTTSTASTFSNLDQLAALINTSQDFKASISSPSGGASLKVYNIDPTDTITFTDSIAGDDILDDLGLTSTAISAVYDATASNPHKTMASGNIPADFSRTITIFTSLGESLDLRLAFSKIADGENLAEGGQTWAVELYAPDASDVQISNRTDGLLASGTVVFDGNGNLISKSTNFDNISIDPTGGASEQTISLNLGSVDSTDGLSQYAGQYSIDELSQNGFPTGRLQSLDIDAQGFVTAIFDNSLTSKVYKLPLAFFSNPNGLTPEVGNAYSASGAAGEVTFGQVGDASVGTIVPSALEVSTAEIGQELTTMILSQQTYSASANVLRKVTELFERLENL